MVKRSDKGPNLTYRGKFSSFLCAAFQSYSNDLVLTLYGQHHMLATISVSTANIFLLRIKQMKAWTYGMACVLF